MAVILGRTAIPQLQQDFRGTTDDEMNISDFKKPKWDPPISSQRGNTSKAIIKELGELK